MKRLILFIICIISIFTLTGCMKRDAINTEKFKQEAEKQGYIITDIKEDYSSYENIKEVTAAMKGDNYKIEFFVFDTNKDAKNMFEAYLETIETESSGEVNMINYSTYSGMTSDNYVHLGRIENTLLYTIVPKEYQNDAIKFIKSLDYL